MAAAMSSSPQLPRTDFSEPLTGSLPPLSSSMGGTARTGDTYSQRLAGNGTAGNGAGAGASEGAESDGESTGAGASQRRSRARNLQDWDSIPKVKDLTGEKVCEDFLAFLER